MSKNSTTSENFAISRLGAESMKILEKKAFARDEELLQRKFSLQ